MNDNAADGAGKVVYLRASHERAVWRRVVRERTCDAARSIGVLLAALAARAVGVFLRFARLCLCAVLVLLEPLLRAVLVPVAFLGFVVTLVFGFLIGDPRFPRWGMLAFSIGTLVLYWLYLGLMSLVMRLPRDTH